MEDESETFRLDAVHKAVIKIGTVSPALICIGDDEYLDQTPSQMLSGPRGAMPVPLNDGRLRWRVPVDRTTAEIFGARGQAREMFVRSNAGGNVPRALKLNVLLSGGVSIEKWSAHVPRSGWAT